MGLLLETIKIEDGVIFNLSYHQQRVNQTRKKLFNLTNILNLEKNISPPSKGVYRCRILYDLTIKNIEYIPYKIKDITSLKIVSSSLEYKFKYKNRKLFDILLNIHNKVDDIIIEKDGYLTDISYANIAFYDTKKWITPQKPLLKGTMREKLINEGFLNPCNIQKEMLKDYTKIAILNAMVGFKVLTKIDPHTL